MGHDIRLVADLEGGLQGDHINFHHGLCSTGSFGLATSLFGPAAPGQGDAGEAAPSPTCEWLLGVQSSNAASQESGRKVGHVMNLSKMSQTRHSLSFGTAQPGVL